MIARQADPLELHSRALPQAPAVQHRAGQNVSRSDVSSSVCLLPSDSRRCYVDSIAACGGVVGSQTGNADLAGQHFEDE